MFELPEEEGEVEEEDEDSSLVLLDWAWAAALVDGPAADDCGGDWCSETNSANDVRRLGLAPLCWLWLLLFD